MGGSSVCRSSHPHDANRLHRLERIRIRDTYPMTQDLRLRFGLNLSFWGRPMQERNTAARQLTACQRGIWKKARECDRRSIGR
ncbi:hypothetical protein RGR602_PC00318 (plasmid) [Rhizobium gallicum bv. gallicum R602sp]|uniref:Uncharacterized protein n=1 Tax=Rhizobium gallicum bv. gallicum R602sp TaxID=1041138 RepID=A0A0B4XB94_9HYPH|nr:hypothetical protein RGR602_PC00318 [Rhizobium gallicum bv. gallicum R602sp]